MKMVLKNVAHEWFFHLNSMWVAPFVGDRQVSAQNYIENLAVGEIVSSATYFICKNVSILSTSK